MKTTVFTILQKKTFFANKKITIFGWVKQFRAQKNIAFLELNDGSCLTNLHLVCKDLTLISKMKQTINIGASLKATGQIVLSQNREQALELQVFSFEVLGKSDDTFPLQKKEHSLVFLREQAHLRARTTLFAAIFKIRSLFSFAIHHFFQKERFLYVNTPIITSSDAEGAGDVFEVINKRTKKEEEYFFGKKAFLTVSGQLEAEALTLGLGKVYNFGPTFRAENSHTQKHLSEFWMFEAEMAFFDLSKLIIFIQKFIKKTFTYLLKHGLQELTFLSQKNNIDLISRIQNIIQKKIPVITYKKAIAILQKQQEVDFQFLPSLEEDLAKEHEKYLTTYFNGPVFVIDWPKKIKPFYTKLNKDNKTVAAVDLLFPEIGEIMSGSQREEDFEQLSLKIAQFQLSKQSLSWFLDTRKYGSCFHSGFGFGLERIIMFLTGTENIRDVIPFPRVPGKIF